MANQILTKVDNEIRKYKAEHRGEEPLYILISPHEADRLLDEVRNAGGYDDETVVTTYKESKIIKHDSLTKGEIRLTNDLPDTGS
jgi:hypothetical protein